MTKPRIIAAAFGAGFAAASLILASANGASALDGTTLKDATMHIGPAADFPTVGSVPAGTEILINGCMAGNGWCAAEFSGRHGWIPSESVSITGITRARAKFEDVIVVIDVTGQTGPLPDHLNRTDRRDFGDARKPRKRRDADRVGGSFNDDLFDDFEEPYNTSSSDRYTDIGRYYDRRFGQYYGYPDFDGDRTPYLRFYLGDH